VVDTAETKKEKPNERERLFAHFCAALGNPPEAAARAGYPPGGAGEAAANLLERAEIRRLIEKNARRLTDGDLTSLALRGLLRLAFGPANDVARLMLEESDSEAIGSKEPAGLDLFMVSEIKRPKGGGWEVKLHDRLEALKMLLDHASARQVPENGSFYQALRESAASAALEDEPDAL